MLQISSKKAHLKKWCVLQLDARSLSEQTLYTGKRVTSNCPRRCALFLNTQTTRVHENIYGINIPDCQGMSIYVLGLQVA